MPKAPLNFHFYAEAPNPYAVGMRVNMGVDLFPKGFTPEELNVVYEGLLNGRGAAGLILEGAAFADVESYYNPGWESVSPAFILEAITIDKFSRTEKRMAALARVLNKYLADNKEITALDPIVGDPKKSGSFAYVMVQMPFSDGQVVSVVFHSPEGDKKRIGPEDSLIAFRWLLNKRDITHVVAPEDGAEVSLETIGKRVTQLVEKNSARFQSTQKDAVMQQKQLDDAKAALDAANAQERQVMDSISAAQAAAQEIDAKASAMQKQLESQKAINADLENQIAALKAKQAAKPDVSVTGAENTNKLIWEEAIKLIKWEKGEKGFSVAAFYAPEDNIRMQYGEIEDTKISVGRNSADRYKTSDGSYFEKKTDAMYHELESYTKPRLIKDGYVAGTPSGHSVTGGDGGETSPYVAGFSWDSKDGKRTIVGHAEGRPEGWLEISTEGNPYNQVLHVSDVPEEVNRDTKNLESYNRDAAKQAENDAKAAEERAKYEDVGGFADSMNEMNKGRVLKDLNAPIRLDGDVMTRKKFVETLVARGEQPSTREEYKIKEMSRRAFNNATQQEQNDYARRREAAGKKIVFSLGNYDITKTEYDYAQYLIAKTAAQPAPQGEQDNTTEAEVPTPGVAYFRVKKTGVDWSIFTNEGKEILAYIEKSEAVRNAEILETSRRYVGAFNKAEAVFAEDSKQQYQQVSKYAGKSVREEYLKNRYGISGAEARNLTNIETSENIPADKSANVTIEEFKGEPWADNAIAKMQPAATGGPYTFTAYKLNLDGTVSDRENLAESEIDGWMGSVYGKYANIRVVRDQDGNTIDYTDDGEKWVVASKSSEGEPQPAEPAPAPETPHAVETLNAIIRGDYQGQPEQIDRLLDECADELEKAGLFDQYEGLLNQAADILTSELSEKAKAVA